MKRPQQLLAARVHYWLAPLCLVLAFQLNQDRIFQQVAAIQSSNGEQHNSVASGQEHPGIAQSGPAMLSLGSESSSALESSAALAGDDLIAAESSQSPDAAEHKTFTNAQVVRQDSQQMPSSVQPVFAPQQPQQAQPQQHQAPPQQQSQQNQQQQQQQHQLYNVHPQHMAMRIPSSHQAANAGGGPVKPFNPFMAAALAGNYGPQQQQIAAATLQQHAQHSHVQPQLHAPPSHAYPHAHPQQMMGPHQQHPSVHVHQMVSQQQQHGPQMHQQIVRQPQAQQVAAVAAATAIAPSVPEPPVAMAVQESTVRSNVVPAPNFNSMVDSNSIELNEVPVAAASQREPSLSSSLQTQATREQPQALASAQHPVIAASNAMQEAAANAWPLQAPDIPKITNLEVKCEKNLMKVSIEFDKVFNGVIFSKGHYNQGQCLHVGQNSGKQAAYFDISINSCGTQGNTQNGLYGMGGNTGSGTYFENTIVVQYDPNVQEVYDHARKLRCTWHDQYEKAVTFRPFPVDMLDIVRADFAGDNVGCWMQIQVGKGPWASEVAGIVKIGQTMTMVLAIKDEENKFDMLVRNCFAHDGKRGPIELVDKSGCITRPKLMSRFTKIKNFGSSATVLSYAHFQAFKFPDSMEVHFQCTIQICRHQCPEQCSAGPNAIGASNGESYSESTISGTFNIHGNQANNNGINNVDSVHLRKYGQASSSPSGALSRERRDTSGALNSWNGSQPISRHYINNRSNALSSKPMTQTIGLNRVIQVVSTGDLAFAFPNIQQQQQFLNSTSNNDNGQIGDLDDLSNSGASQLTRVDLSNQICMSSYNFVLSLVILVLIILCSSLIAISLYLRQKSYAKRSNKLLAVNSTPSSSTCSSPVSLMRTPPPPPTTTNSNNNNKNNNNNVPTMNQQQHHHHHHQQLYNNHRNNNNNNSHHHHHHNQHASLMFDSTLKQH